MTVEKPERGKEGEAGHGYRLRRFWRRSWSLSDFHLAVAARANECCCTALPSLPIRNHVWPFRSASASPLARCTGWLKRGASDLSVRHVLLPRCARALDCSTDA